MNLIVIGGGELARVIIETARASGLDVIGFTDPQPCKETCERLDVRRLGDDSALVDYPDAELVLGIGAIDVSQIRERIAASINSHAWRSVISPDASVSPTATIEPGAIILPGAVICTGAHIGAHAIVNLGAKIDHDVQVGRFVHVAPQAALGGGSSVGDNAYIGMGAVVRDHVRVRERTLVGMGAVVAKEFPAGSRLVGVPARPL